MDPIVHIGKRSAAGLYCWKCNVTLCIGGVEKIHYGRNNWYSVCPICHEAPINESQQGSGYVELGLAEPKPERPYDVRSCASFSWAQDHIQVLETCNKNLDTQIIADEYGRKLTGKEFIDMLATNCPIEYFTSVGKQFA